MTDCTFVSVAELLIGLGPESDADVARTIGNGLNKEDNDQLTIAPA